MSISQRDLLDYVITPSTKAIGSRSAASDILLLGTCELESQSGKYLKQIGGPAIGIFQMEPYTHNSLINSELRGSTINIIMKISMLPSKAYMKPAVMAWNLYYATLMARAKYMTKPQPLPKYNDAKGMAEYYKLHYNTPLGATKIEKAQEVFEKIIKDFSVD